MRQEAIHNFVSRMKNLRSKMPISKQRRNRIQGLWSVNLGIQQPRIQTSLISREENTDTRHRDLHSKKPWNYKLHSIQRETGNEVCTLTTAGKLIRHVPRNKCSAYSSTCLKCGKASHCQSACTSGEQQHRYVTVLWCSTPALDKAVYSIVDSSNQLSIWAGHRHSE